MTAAELIKLLKRVDPETLVYITKENSDVEVTDARYLPDVNVLVLVSEPKTFTSLSSLLP